MKAELLVTYFSEAMKPLHYLMNLVPEDKYDWSPDDSMMKLGILVSHLASSPEIIAQAATSNWPTEFNPPTPMPKAEALTLLAKLEKQTADVLGQLDPANYGEHVKAPWGAEGTRFSMVMSMIDHIIHHKMQLFIYLKHLGHKISSMELYYGVPTEQ